MAPDRGVFSPAPARSSSEAGHDERRRNARVSSGPSPPIIEGRSLTVRGVLVGLLIGMVICSSNMYFGFQTGWVSILSMPSSLMGFGFFKTFARHLKFPFSPVENVLVQTVAGSMAIMPLGCGFVGVLPAMNYLLTPDEQGPVNLSLWKLMVWSLGLCYFGVLFAVPLRRQVIIRERLKFPSGFSTAVLISVLHGKSSKKTPSEQIPADFASLAGEDEPPATAAADAENELLRKQEWKANLRLLLICFLTSGVFTLATYFLPIIRNLPVFGPVAAHDWLWTLNPSFAYLGQGIIMGPATVLHMMLGAVVGWAVLSPVAKYNGWAPGPVDDWENGSKGWIVWVSLAIMLTDAIVSLGYLAFRPAMKYLPHATTVITGRLPRTSLHSLLRKRQRGYTSVSTDDNGTDVSVPPSPASPMSDFAPEGSARGDEDIDGELDEASVEERDAPPEQQISNKVVWIGLVASVLFCILCIHIVFGDLVPLYATFTAVLMALLLSIMGVRALGETDLNPVSGISKLAQLVFAFIVPQGHKSSVLINLVAGAVSEAGALQAGDLMQDLKTGHLLGAAPSAQFYGQIIGATCGAIFSALLYQLYTAVYQIPGDLFQVPTSYVWLFTARLVTGKGLPYMAREAAIGSSAIYAVLTSLRIYLTNSQWQAYIPGGIAVAVGMYNVPSFTLARTIGGLLAWYWRASGRDDTRLIVMASGFILGEGFLSIVNLVMQSFGVPHL